MRTLAIIILCTLLTPVGVHAATATASVAVSATVVTKSSCRFQTGNANIAFSLDPFSPSDVSFQDAATITVRCGGSADPATFAISDDGGVNDAVPGQKRLKYTDSLSVAHYIPYTMSYSPSTIPRNTNVPLVVTASVLGANYVNAYAGTYSDLVTITITP